MSNQKYVTPRRLSVFLDNIKQMFSAIGHKHTVAEITDYKVDTALSSTSTNPVQNKVLDAEFEAISEAINACDSALDDKADANHDHDDRYFTESEMTTKLAGKSDTGHNHDTAYDAKGTAEEKANAVQSNLDTVNDTLTGHTDNADIHTTAAKKTNWDKAYTHSQATHARTDATNVADSTTNGNILINGTETNVYSHPNSGVTAGTYKSVTVNAQGHVTSGSNPTTLAGYGITDAESKGAANTALNSAKEYTDSVVSGKADSEHTHDGRYYTESEIDSKLSGKSDTSHNHNTSYDSKGTASSAVSTHNTATTAHSDIRDLITGLTTRLNTLANSTDEDLDQMAEIVAYIKSNKSLIDSITTSKVNVADIIDNLTTNVTNKPLSAAQGVAIKALIDALQEEVDSKADSSALTSHTGNTSNPHSVTKAQVGLGNVENKSSATIRGEITKANVTTALGYTPYTQTQVDDLLDAKSDDGHGHAIADVSGLQSALDGKAASSHGTHVSYSTTAPVMDGTASVGTASTVARSDHKHPTDTTRAAQTSLDSHTGNTTVHITSTERTNWNAAKTHADSAHAPINAQANQNAFSNVKVGDTTIAADTTTDTLTLAGSNVTITPDATNDKVTFSVADGSTSAKGVVQLTNSTSSTSTTTAATPNSVKSAYDLANTAKTNAATAQTRADNAYTLAESKADSLSDLGVTATATELNYMDGVTSAVQSQLDGKAASSHTHTIANIDNLQTSLDGKANTSHGNHVPATETANNAKFLRNDNTWATVTPANIGALSTTGTAAKATADASGNVITSTYMTKANPTGTGSFSLNRKADTVIGDCSFAEGTYIESSGYASHAEGNSTTASGDSSHAEGSGTTASGYDSHAEGCNTVASGDASHAEGFRTLAEENYSHAEGCCTEAFGTCSHAEGGNLDPSSDVALDDYTYTLSDESTITVAGSTAQGMQSHAEGTQTLAYGYSSHAEGMHTLAEKIYSHAEGSNTKALGESSHAEGKNTTASGQASHAEGLGVAEGEASHAEGVGVAIGDYSHAEGSGYAEGESSHAENYAEAFGDRSHAEGGGEAHGDYSHSEGFSYAYGDYSHAEGFSYTYGDYSHAEGSYTYAYGGQHVQGKYNIPDEECVYAHIVGNGNANLNIPSNAHTLDWEGNAWFAGDVTTASGASLNTLNSKLPVSIGKIVTYTASAANTFEYVTSVTIPAKSFFVITCFPSWNYNKPLGVRICTSSTASREAVSWQEQDGSHDTDQVSCTYSGYAFDERTYYIWGKWAGANTNSIHVNGFYIPE